MVVLESRGGLHIWWVFIGFQSCVKMLFFPYKPDGLKASFLPTVWW